MSQSIQVRTCCLYRHNAKQHAADDAEILHHAVHEVTQHPRHLQEVHSAGVG